MSLASCLSLRMLLINNLRYVITCLYQDRILGLKIVFENYFLQNSFVRSLILKEDITILKQIHITRVTWVVCQLEISI